MKSAALKAEWLRRFFPWNELSQPLSSTFGFLALPAGVRWAFRHTDGLGAEGGAILGMVLRETAVIVLAGIAMGVSASWLNANTYRTYLQRLITDIM